MNLYDTIANLSINVINPDMLLFQGRSVKLVNILIKGGITFEANNPTNT
jgi:hypothetical protein